MSSYTLMIAIPFMSIGGAERLFSQMTGYLSERGWRVIVVSTENQDESLGDASGWFQRYTPEVYALPRFLPKSDWHQFVEYLLISKRPDCLLTAGSQFFYKLLPTLSRHHPEMAIVDILFNTVGHTVSHKKYMGFYSAALAENNEVFAWYRNIGWDESRLRVVRSGVDLDIYRPRPKPSDLVKLYGITPADIVVGFSGRLSPEKAPEIFIEIARLCQGIPNLRFIMTGDGPMNKEVCSLVSRLPSSVRFDFVGFVDVAPYLSLYDILVLPSRVDGRPMVVLEGLACGLPIIASRIGALTELILEDQNGYLCSPAIAEEFAVKISALAMDKLKLEYLKTGARAFAEMHLDAEVMFAEHEEALRSFIIRQRAKSAFGSTE